MFFVSHEFHDYPLQLSFFKILGVDHLVVVEDKRVEFCKVGISVYKNFNLAAL